MTLIKDYTAEDLQNAFDKGRATGRAERDWIGLTDEDCHWILDNARDDEDMMEMTEAKLKEKNHGT